MVSTPSPSLQLEIPGAGDYRGEWEQVMQRLLTQIDKSIAGVTSITTTGGTIELSDTQYLDNQSRQSTISVSGALVGNVVIVVPARSKRYILLNKTTGANSVSIKTAMGDPLAGPSQGSVEADGTIIRVGPYVNFATGAITSTNYALQASLQAEIDRATGEEVTLIKRDGSRSFSAPVAGIAPTANNHLATKQYVDNAAGLQDNIFTTAGTSAAYAVATGGGLALFDGLALSIRLHATNAKDCTLAVDGNDPKPIRGFTGKSLSAGVGIAGTPYRVIYVAATQEWLFSGFFQNPYQVPIGGFLPFCSTAVPNSNFILPFGQALSRVIYVDFYNLVGTAFGAGDGVNTFNAPDVRGRSIFGLDNMGGAAAGRITRVTGTTVGAAGGDESAIIARSNLPNVQLGGSTSWSGDHAHGLGISLQNYRAGDADHGVQAQGLPGNSATYGAGNHAHSIVTDSINGGVAQEAMSNLPPLIMLPMLLRVI